MKAGIAGKMQWFRLFFVQLYLFLEEGTVLLYEKILPGYSITVNNIKMQHLYKKCCIYDFQYIYRTHVIIV